MLKVKVCGMNNSLNVKDISDLGPDFLGFIFYAGSSRYVGDNPDMNLFQNVPSGITKVGVFVNEDPDKIIALAKKYRIEMIQLHGNESPDYCRQLGYSGLKIIKAINLSHYFDFEAIIPYLSVSDYFLFDTRSENRGGSGKKFDWDILAGYKLDLPFFLSGGIGPEDSEKISSMTNIGLFAVDINSRFESAPGVKNVPLVKIFIDTFKNSQV